MKKLLSLFLVAVCVFALLCALQSCSAAEVYSEGDGEIEVLCTSFVPFDLARVVGGELVTVSILQDSGSDLHNYTPTSATLEALSRADVFIYIGGVSDEAWLDDAIAAAGNKDLITLRLMDHIAPIYAELENDWSSHEDDGHTDEDHVDDGHTNDSHANEGHEGHGHNGHGHEGHVHGADEHIWTSVKNAIKMTEAISELFCSIDGDSEAIYRKNSDDYIEQLNQLDAELTNIAANSSKTLLFADRFPFVYLMHDYHIPYKAAFSGCSTEVNSGFEIQIQLIEAVREQELDYVLTLEGGDKALCDAICAETGCKAIALDSMQSVTRADIENGYTYLNAMINNVRVLKEVLQ